jgi:hypothetical protein
LAGVIGEWAAIEKGSWNGSVGELQLSQVPKIYAFYLGWLEECPLGLRVEETPSKLQQV